MAAGDDQEIVFALLDLHHVRFRLGETIEAFEDVLDSPPGGRRGGARARTEFVRQWSWARLEFEQAMTGLVHPEAGEGQRREALVRARAALEGLGHALDALEGHV